MKAHTGTHGGSGYSLAKRVQQAPSNCTTVLLGPDGVYIITGLDWWTGLDWTQSDQTRHRWLAPNKHTFIVQPAHQQEKLQLAFAARRQWSTNSSPHNHRNCIQLL